MSNASDARMNRALRSLLRCSIAGCVSTQRLEFHHILPTELVPNGRGRGRNARIRDIVNHPQSYLPFCRSHHRKKVHDGRRQEEWNVVELAFIQPVQSPLRGERR